MPAMTRWCNRSCGRKGAADDRTGAAGGRRPVRPHRVAALRGCLVHDWRTAARVRPKARGLYRVPQHHRSPARGDRPRVRCDGRLHTDITPPADPDGKFRVRLEITEDLHQLVRADSVAAIQTEGLVGGSFLAVNTGTSGTPRAAAGSTIPSREPFLLSDLFQQMSDTVGKVNATVDDLSASIKQALASVDTTVGTANALIDDVSEDVRILASASARITSDAAQIAEGIRKGEGTIGNW